MTELRWVAVMSTADVPEGQVGAATVEGYEIAIYHLPGGEFRATDNVCTHGQAYLSDGWIVDDCQIECPLHAGCFEIRTGKAVGPPAEVDIATYEVRTDGVTIEVGLPQ
jgi:nitrite reductase/ring-hydroxylating ferredoxin subunit